MSPAREMRMGRTDGEAAPIFQTQRQRQRKFHRRSRNGCSTCKNKHIRCDERKPLCTYCLRHGGECGYPDGDAGFHVAEAGFRSGSWAGSREPHQPTEPFLRRVDATPNDPFLATYVPRESQWLFRFFTNTRVLYTTRVERGTDSFLVRKALSHPGFLHAALLMTILHWAWSNDDAESFHVHYSHHKAQARKFVTHQLYSRNETVHDGTIAAVWSLALVENALGSIDDVKHHLKVLAFIKEQRDEKRRPVKMGLLQRMILMAANSVASRPVWDILDISRTDSVHQSVIISLLRVALRPIYSLCILGSSYDCEKPLFEVLTAKSPYPRASDSSVVAPVKSIDDTRSGFIACYFYLYVIMREGTVDSFILSWFIEQLLADVYRTEVPMQEGQYSQPLWFWSVMFGTCAMMTTPETSDDLERSQMKRFRDEYLSKVSLASEVLRIKNWEAAKSVLRLFAWEDDFDGEMELKALWEEAVWGDDGRRLGGHGVGHVDYQTVR
ncbi:hypothetical protein GGS23DRAFT_608753 [Durotheca rogersii]|uniref:uncharacterized protein n=1 Tax=Durotheca rogersii TaxID=419775 RepID=UPI00221F181D|nr:uncharacterized protein GGS23DRAFT_608753 [Durotheca rogersii]KAI5868179.1 hypothetical protein GGS23DRAFT_608753 [Durotheca rogersii]